MKKLTWLLLVTLLISTRVLWAQLTVLHNFTMSPDGSNPGGTLYFDGNFLYGMTGTGGVNNIGTLFKVQTNGTGYTKLLDFNSNTSGSYPQGPLISDGTYLYGVTAQGGANSMGTIFKIDRK